MPSETERQRVAAAIAEHYPEKLYKRNRGMLKMSRSQLHDFAVKRKGKKRSKRDRLRRLYLDRRVKTGDLKR